MDVLLTTERLILRRFTQDDAEALHKLHTDPDVIRHTNAAFLNNGRGPDFASVAQTTLPGFIARYPRDGVFAYWAAAGRENQAFLGWFQFTPTEAPGAAELGYRLRKAAWGQGLATEGARALVERGFGQWGLERIVASALVANLASIRVMEKLGLRPLREFVHDPCGPAVLYALDREDFEAAQVPPGTVGRT